MKVTKKVHDYPNVIRLFGISVVLLGGFGNCGPMTSIESFGKCSISDAKFDSLSIPLSIGERDVVQSSIILQ